MADNVTLPGTASVVAADDVSSVFYQKMKLDAGGDGVSVPIVAGQQTMSASVPVVAASDQTALTTSATWDTGTPTNTAITLATSGFASAVIHSTPSGLTGGQVNIEGSVDGSTWFAVSLVHVEENDTAFVSNITGTSAARYRCEIAGFTNVRARLQTAITGGTRMVVLSASNASASPRLVFNSPLTGSTQVTSDADLQFDNIGFTDGITKVRPAGFIFDETPGTALTENDVGASRMDSKRAQICTIEDETTRGRRATVTASNALKVDASGVAVPITDNSGSLTVDGTITASNTAGDIAHDGVNSGNPVQIGVQAISHGTNPTAVASADRTKLYANVAGVPFVIGGHPNVFTYGMSITTGATNAIVGPTIGSGLILVVTHISFLLDNASTVFPSVVIGFGASTTPAFATTPGTIKVLAGHPACPAGGGYSKGDGSGIIGCGADGDELRITTVGTAGGNGIYVLMSGYTIES